MTLPLTSTTPGTLGTPLTPGATRVLLLGAGELGKEVCLLYTSPSPRD